MARAGIGAGAVRQPVAPARAGTGAGVALHPVAHPEPEQEPTAPATP